MSSQRYGKSMTSVFDGKQQLVIMEQGKEMPILKTPDPRLDALAEDVLTRNGFVICHTEVKQRLVRGQTEVKQRSSFM